MATQRVCDHCRKPIDTENCMKDGQLEATTTLQNGHVFTLKMQATVSQAGPDGWGQPSPDVCLRCLTSLMAEIVPNQTATRSIPTETLHKT